MLLTEDQVGIRVGLPGPVVAELLQPGHRNDHLIGSQTPQFCDADVLRAQVAALMLSAGVRWPYVQTAMVRIPTTIEELRWTRDFWTDIAPSPIPSRHWPFAATVLATALMVLSLLAGILLGMSFTPGGLL